MLYAAVKHLHIACVILSVVGFCLRGFLRARNSALAERRWLRILPHINDTVLLGAALALAAMVGQYPFLHAWLTAKVFGLIAYIVLGALALRPGQDARARPWYLAAAVATFGWIVSVALTKNPLGIFA